MKLLLASVHWPYYKRNKKRLIQYVERDNTHLLTMNFVIFILEIMLHYMRYIMR